jgi:hypothetical protein
MILAPDWYLRYISERIMQMGTLLDKECSFLASNPLPILYKAFNCAVQTKITLHPINFMEARDGY